MKLELKDIKPNPFRDLVRNPLNEMKLKALETSISLTDFWENVLVRQNKNGEYELAYGHHRLEAAKRAGIVETNFIVKDIEDERMIVIMDNDNRAVYGASVLSAIEAVRAMVLGLAEGIVKPFGIDLETSRIKKDSIRYAPSFVPGEPRGDDGRTSTIMAYTASLLAERLGRTKCREGKEDKRADESIIAALNYLELLERGEMQEISLGNEFCGGGKGVDGLLRETLRLKALVKARTERRVKTSEELSALQQERVEQDKLRRESEDEAKLKKQELARQVAEANREEDRKKAARLSELMKKSEENRKLRAEQDKKRREELDAKIAAQKERADAEKVVDKYRPTHNAVNLMLSELGRIYSEKNSLRERIKSLANDKALTAGDRELVRQEALKAGTWFTEWVAAQFLPPLTGKKELKAMQSREEAKRRAAKKENK